MHTEQMGEQALDAIFEDYLRHYESAWRAYDDVRPRLLALRGVRVAVLSTGNPAQQEDKVRRTGLRPPGRPSHPRIQVPGRPSTERRGPGLRPRLSLGE
jgi:hypothetical protein